MKKRSTKKAKAKRWKRTKTDPNQNASRFMFHYLISPCGMNQSRCGLSFLNVESLISLISLHLSHVPQETGDLHTSRHQWAAATGPHSPPRPSRTSDRCQNCQIMIYNDIYVYIYIIYIYIYHDINMSWCDTDLNTSTRSHLPASHSMGCRGSVFSAIPRRWSSVEFSEEDRRIQETVRSGACSWCSWCMACIMYTWHLTNVTATVATLSITIWVPCRWHSEPGPACMAVPIHNRNNKGMVSIISPKYWHTKEER